MKPVLTADVVRSLLDCNIDTGELRWKERELSFFTSERMCKIWNTNYAGKITGTCVGNNGYRTVTIFNKRYLCHRVIWFIHTGEWPVGLIDHVNMDKLDNRICNLREATKRQNSANSKLCTRNKTGLRGVFKVSNPTRWVAQIKRNGVSTHLGTFDCPAAAGFAYQIAADGIFGEFARVA